MMFFIMHGDFLRRCLYFIRLRPKIPLVALFSNTVQCVLFPSASETEIQTHRKKFWEELIVYFPR
jgi:hypothetical protein